MSTLCATLIPFKSAVSMFDCDLSESNLIDVILAYEKHRKRTSPNYSQSATVSILKKLEADIDYVLYPKDVTDQFYSYFINWMINRELKSNTMKVYCGAIRAALNWSVRHHVEVSSTYDDFCIPEQEPHRVALTADDVSHIAHFDVSTIKVRPQHLRTLERVRDMFVIQTNLFQRYSDTVRISRANFNRNIFSCVQQKTGNKARVDIDLYSITPELTYSLLEKYDYTAPYTGDINNYNKYLHELLRNIGGSFNEEIIFEDKVNGEIVTTKYKKYQLISSHCSRRTAITLASKHSKTETEIRRCSGHKNRSDSFQRYIIYNE